MEQKGRMPEAIRYYRQAIQLLPDIESRISDFNELVPKNGENVVRLQDFSVHTLNRHLSLMQTPLSLIQTPL